MVGLKPRTTAPMAVARNSTFNRTMVGLKRHLLCVNFFSTAYPFNRTMVGLKQAGKYELALAINSLLIALW